jgi:Dioxygenase
MHPCPATGLTRGPCPGCVKDHVVPLACGGPDAVSNACTHERRASSSFARLSLQAIPSPVGDLLRVQHREPYRPAHLHVMGYKPGYKTLITQVFVPDDPYIENDVVFGVTRTLMGDYRRHDGELPALDVTPPWYTLDYTFVMEPGEAKRPVPPIK